MSITISILGSGFSSLSSACNLCREGHDVTIYEKNKTFGGRATQIIHKGYKFDIVIDFLETLTKNSVKQIILFVKSYFVNDFIDDYNFYKGNAYGLTNTLTQTALLRPRIKNKTVSNLFFTGQLTVPGPGVPPALISGKIAAESISKHFGS